MIYYVYRYLRYDLKSDTYIRDEHIASLQKCIRGGGTEGRREGCQIVSTTFPNDHHALLSWCPLYMFHEGYTVNI